MNNLQHVHDNTYQITSPKGETLSLVLLGSGKCYIIGSTHSKIVDSIEQAMFYAKIWD